MKIAVFDHDFKEEDFIKAISDCEKYKIFPAYSNISFNLFLILHKKKYNKKIINNVYEQPYLNINKFLELVFKELNE